MFNLLIIGYSHTLLTEAIAPAIIMLSLYLVFKWRDTFINKCINIVYTICFSLILIFIWFLKQPYLPIILLLLLLDAILTGIVDKSWKIFGKKILNISMCLLILFISIITWNKVLESNNIRTDLNNNFLANGIVKGLSYHFQPIAKEKYCDLNYIKNSNLKEKNNIIELSKNNDNWCDSIKVFNVVTSKGIIDEMAIISNDTLTASDSIKYFFRATIKHPLLVFDNYYKNYLAEIDIYKVSTGLIDDNITGYKMDWDYNRENDSLGYAAFYDNEAYCWWQKYWQYNLTIDDIENNTYVEYMKDYEGYNHYNDTFNFMFKFISPLYLMIFKITFLLLLPLCAYAFYKFLKDKYNLKYYICTIIFVASFGHILFHAVMGAVIDRYAFAALPITLLGIIILLMPNKKEKMIKVQKIPFKENGKTIFVVPAYNEEKNIEKVVKDINKNMPKADIVVINDYSNDQTQAIIESLKVPCLNVPFNLGYAMAVQTGIKYAYENNYDYVIQFDADGQHLASEASKLVKKMKETNANIIIGSRFIEKTDYKHPLFRKIGTKIFSILIKLFCNKKITDPTSGFQLLDRTVIERYAKIGKYPEFPDANLIIEMLLNGYEIEEVSVKMKLNDTGQSMHGGIIKPIKYMINVLYTICYIIIQYSNKKGN